jgi:hypothetical protein
LGDWFVTFCGNIVPVSSSVKQFMKNGIPIEPLATWKGRHCVLSGHEKPLVYWYGIPSQKTRILWFINVLFCMIIYISECTEFRILYKTLSTNRQPVRLRKKVNMLSATDTAMLSVQTEIFRQVVECCRRTYTHLVGESGG